MISEDEASGMEMIGISFNNSAKAEDPALVMTKFAKL